MKFRSRDAGDKAPLSVKARSAAADSLGPHGGALGSAHASHRPQALRTHRWGWTLWAVRAEELPLQLALEWPTWGWGLPLTEGLSLLPSSPRHSPGEGSQRPTHRDRDSAHWGLGDMEAAGKDRKDGSWGEEPPHSHGAGTPHGEERTKGGRRMALVRDGGGGSEKPSVTLAGELQAWVSRRR